ncbi:MAG: hypothetical protein RI969_904 [Verrucomicrobiota bacterium]|jgi:hypothetical protein
MRLLAILAVGLLVPAFASAAPKKEDARKEPAKPEPKPSAVIKADPRTGANPRGGVPMADALGRTQTRYDNGVTAVKTPDAIGGSTTRYSNGVTAVTRPDATGGTTTTFSDGTRAITRKDAAGNQVTTYSDGRREVLRPDPFAPRKPANERK